MIVRRWLAPALSVCFLAGAYARPDFHLASGDETPTSVAKHALACLEKLDARGVGLLLSDREVAQTGLGPTAAAAILKGPYAKATSGYKADGPPEVEKLDVDQVAIERSYRMANGRHYLLTFVVTGNGKEIKLTPFSMQLFVALGNSEQAVGKTTLRHGDVCSKRTVRCSSRWVGRGSFLIRLTRSIEVGQNWTSSLRPKNSRPTSAEK